MTIPRQEAQNPLTVLQMKERQFDKRLQQQAFCIVGSVASVCKLEEAETENVHEGKLMEKTIIFGLGQV